MAAIRTVTTLVSAVAITAGTPALSTSPTVTTLAIDTAAFALHGKIKGVGQMQPNSCVRLYYKCLPYDNTDGTREQAVMDAGWIDLMWNQYPGQYSVSSTKALPAVAGALFWWYEVPSLPFGATVTITLVESNVTLNN